MSKKTDKLLEILSSAQGGDVNQGVASLLEIAADLEVEVIFDSDWEKYPYGWDGKALRIEIPVSNPRTVYDLAHELGHWICSTPERRLMPEFGLGPGSSTSGDFYEEMQNAQVLPNHESQNEEEMVCILAGIILHQIGVDVVDESQLVKLIDLECNWYQDLGFDLSKTLEKIEYIINNLELLGLITADLKFTGNARSGGELENVPLNYFAIV